MDFLGAMKTELDGRKTLTENGAVAYATSGKELLDFLFAVSALRQADADVIKNRFAGIYYEDPMVAIKFLFWLRDCRGGNGERRIFRECLKWLAENKPDITMAILELVPEYGRWDDLWVLLDNTQLKDDVIDLIKKQLHKDLEAVNYE